MLLITIVLLQTIDDGEDGSEDDDGSDKDSNDDYGDSDEDSKGDNDGSDEDSAGGGGGGPDPEPRSWSVSIPRPFRYAPRDSPSTLLPHPLHSPPPFHSFPSTSPLSYPVLTPHLALSPPVLSLLPSVLLSTHFSVLVLVKRQRKKREAGNECT